LAGFAVANLASGTIKIKAGQTFNAPGLGKYTILKAAAGTGPSIVLGPPFVFTKANVAKFNF
jgi:rhamnose transport system substrate-binding protein